MKRPWQIHCWNTAKSTQNLRKRTALFLYHCRSFYIFHFGAIYL